MKALAACFAAAGVMVGCAVESDIDEQYGTLYDPCTNEAIGYIAEEGSHVFDDGTLMTAEEIDRAVRVDELDQVDCSVLPRDAAPSAGPQADTGSTLFLDYIICVKDGGCCQAVYGRWCWNGSCSSDLVITCE
jgi:hypothetical protein